MKQANRDLLDDEMSPSENNQPQPFNKSEAKRAFILISLITTVLIIFRIFQQYSIYFLNEYFDLSEIIHFITPFLILLIFILVSFILFLFKKKIGWIVLTFYSLMSIFIFSFELISPYHTGEPLFAEIAKDSYAKQFVLQSITILCIYLFLFYKLLNKHLRDMFNINRKTFIVTLISAPSFLVLIIAFLAILRYI